MSFAFRKHNYNLDDFARCPEHGCVLVHVCQDAQPWCLLDWLSSRAIGRQVTDIIPAEQVQADDEYGDAALVLDGGFLLPVEQAFDLERQGEKMKVDLRLTGWVVSDVLYVRPRYANNGNNETMWAELLPPSKHPPGILLRLRMDTLIYLLSDEAIRKHEP
jgi:hypothetical protein